MKVTRIPASGLWTEVEFDFGSTGIEEKIFTVMSDPRVQPLSIVTMVASAKPATGRDEDESEFDIFACAVAVDPVIQAGGFHHFRSYVHSLRGPVVGAYRFNYTVSSAAP